MSDRALMNGKPVFVVPAKTVVNFDSRFDKKLLCDGITFTAGNACNYSCTFCYVRDMQRKAREWHTKHGVVYPREGHSGVVIRIKDAVDLARRQILSKPESFRREKKVIYSSPKVDVAGNMELVRETVAICKVILEHTNWDIRLLSKSNLLPNVAEQLIAAFDASPDACRLVRERVIFGVSTGTLDARLAAAFEIGTAKVGQRIKSIRWLQDNGFRTFGMICPSLPMADYHEFSREQYLALRADRMEHVWAEVINVRGDSFTRTSKALFDAGYGSIAMEMERLSHDRSKWEEYARDTFAGHAAVFPADKLRFLQYVTKETRSYWEPRRGQGAVIL